MHDYLFVQSFNKIDVENEQIGYNVHSRFEYLRTRVTVEIQPSYSDVAESSVMEHGFNNNNTSYIFGILHHLKCSSGILIASMNLRYSITEVCENVLVLCRMQPLL